MGLKRIAYLRNYVFGYKKYRTTLPIRANRDPLWCATNAMEEQADTIVYSRWGIEYEGIWWKRMCWYVSIWLCGMGFALIKYAYPEAERTVRVE